MRQNVVAFLADLFYILEVRPAKCVRPPGLMRDRFPINEGNDTRSCVYIKISILVFLSVCVCVWFGRFAVMLASSVESSGNEIVRLSV